MRATADAHARLEWAGLVALLGVAAGVAAAFMDLRIVAVAVFGAIFLGALARTWQEPKFGLYVAVVTFSLDALGKLPFSETVPITLYQIAIAVTLAAALRAHRTGKMRLAWRQTPVDVQLLLFVVLAFVTVWFAPSLRAGVVTFASLLSSVVLFYLMVTMIDDPNDARALLLWFVLVAVVLGGLALTERVTGVSVAGNVMKTSATGIRVRGSFQDPNMLGMMMMIALTAGIALAIGERGRTRQGLIAAVVVVVVALGLSFSRGAWVAAIAAVIVIVLVYPGKRARRVVPLAVCLALALALAIQVMPPSFVEKRIVGVAEDRSALARVFMMRAGLDIVRQEPLGVGLGGFPFAYPAFRFGDVRPSLVQSHTAYLTIIVELGVLGLALFLWLLWRFFAMVWPDIRDGRLELAARVQLVCACAVLGILVQAWTYSVELSKQLWFLLGIMTAAHLLLPRPKEEGS